MFQSRDRERSREYTESCELATYRISKSEQLFDPIFLRANFEFLAFQKFVPRVDKSMYTLLIESILLASNYYNRVILDRITFAPRERISRIVRYHEINDKIARKKGINRLQRRRERFVVVSLGRRDRRKALSRTGSDPFSPIGLQFGLRKRSDVVEYR